MESGSNGPTLVESYYDLATGKRVEIFLATAKCASKKCHDLRSTSVANNVTEIQNADHPTFTFGNGAQVIYYLPSATKTNKQSFSFIDTPLSGKQHANYQTLSAHETDEDHEEHKANSQEQEEKYDAPTIPPREEEQAQIKYIFNNPRAFNGINITEQQTQELHKKTCQEIQNALKSADIAAQVNIYIKRLEAIREKRWGWGKKSRQEEDNQRIKDLKTQLETPNFIHSNIKGCQAALNAAIDHSTSWFGFARSSEKSFIQRLFDSKKQNETGTELQSLLPELGQIIRNIIDQPITQPQQAHKPQQKTSPEKTVEQLKQELQAAKQSLSEEVQGLRIQAESIRTHSSRKTLHNPSDNSGLIIDIFNTISSIRDYLISEKEKGEQVESQKLAIAEQEQQLEGLKQVAIGINNFVTTAGGNSSTYTLIAIDDANNQKLRELQSQLSTDITSAPKEELTSRINQAKVQPVATQAAINAEVLTSLFDALGAHYRKRKPGYEFSPSEEHKFSLQEKINLFISRMEKAEFDGNKIIPSEARRDAIAAALKIDVNLEAKAFLTQFKDALEHLITVSNTGWFNKRLATELKKLPALKVNPEVYALYTQPITESSQRFKQKAVELATEEENFLRGDYKARIVKVSQLMEEASKFKQELNSQNQTIVQQEERAKKILRQLEALKRKPALEAEQAEKKAKLTLFNQQLLPHQRVFVSLASNQTPSPAADSQATEVVTLDKEPTIEAGDFRDLIFNKINSTRIKDSQRDVILRTGKLAESFIEHCNTTNQAKLITTAMGRLDDSAAILPPSSGHTCLAGAVIFYHVKRQTQLQPGERNTITETNMIVALQYILQLLYLDLETKHYQPDQPSSFLELLQYTPAPKTAAKMLKNISPVKRSPKTPQKQHFCFATLEPYGNCSRFFEQLYNERSTFRSIITELANLKEATINPANYENDRKYIKALIDQLEKQLANRKNDSSFKDTYKKSIADMSENTEVSDTDCAESRDYEECCERVRVNSEIIQHGEEIKLPQYRTENFKTGSASGDTNDEDFSTPPRRSSSRNSLLDSQPRDSSSVGSRKGSLYSCEQGLSIFSGQTPFLSEDDKNLLDKILSQDSRKKICQKSKTLRLESHYQDQVIALQIIAEDFPDLIPMTTLLMALKLHICLGNETDSNDIKTQLNYINNLLSIIQTYVSTGTGVESEQGALRVYIGHIAESLGAIKEKSTKKKYASLKKILDYFSGESVTLSCTADQKARQALSSEIAAFRTLISNMSGHSYTPEVDMRAIQSTATTASHITTKNFHISLKREAGLTTQPLALESLRNIAEQQKPEYQNSVPRPENMIIFDDRFVRDYLTINTRRAVIFNNKIQTSYSKNILLAPIVSGQLDYESITGKALTGLLISLAGSLENTPDIDSSNQLIHHLMKTKVYLYKIIEANLARTQENCGPYNLIEANTSNASFSQSNSFDEAVARFYIQTNKISFSSSTLTVFLKQIFFIAEHIDRHIQQLKSKHHNPIEEQVLDRTDGESHYFKVPIGIDNLFFNLNGNKASENALLLFAPEYLASERAQTDETIRHLKRADSVVSTKSRGSSCGNQKSMFGQTERSAPIPIPGGAQKEDKDTPQAKVSGKPATTFRGLRKFTDNGMPNTSPPNLTYNGNDPWSQAASSTRNGFN